MPPKRVQSFRPRAGVPRKQHERIDGPLDPYSPLPTLHRSSPGRFSTPTPSQTPATPKQKCTNPTCRNPDVQQTLEGSWVCTTCGAVAEQDSQLVSEQQFNEERGGRITAQGQSVAHNQTHQRTFGAPAGSGKANQDEPASWILARRDALQTMQSYAGKLNIQNPEVDAAMAVWTLAYQKKFVQGRGLSNVATVCLYLAVRRKTDQIAGKRRPTYALMLIDFAEIGNIDVFSLGRMYTDLVRCLYLSPVTGRYSNEYVDLLAHGPEVLVDRFVESLEFPPQSVRKIKDDAIRVVGRMKRDWMSDGRRPAGVCGAAVILAARMNNYRRTTREVVLTAKVNEITLNKRLEEFSDLTSSQLSVKDFRNNLILDDVEPANPPAYTRARNPPKPKRKRGRPKKVQPVPETAAEIEGDAGDQENHNGQPPAKRARIDAEGFAIPALPQRSSTEDKSPTSETPPSTEPVRLGRPPGAKNWRAPPVSEAELIIENEIERDLDLALQENPDLDHNPLTLPDGKKVPPLHITAKVDEARAASQQNGNTNTISLGALEETEFEDDEEVANCLLNEEERRMKEIVWVTANADWLRQEHAKKIKRQLLEAEVLAKGGDLSSLDKKGKKDGKWTKRKDGRQRAGAAGDIGYIQEEEERRRRQGTAASEGSQVPVQEGQAGEADGEQSRTRSPSAAPFPGMDVASKVAFMLEFRENVVGSRRLNLNAIEEVYGRRPSSSTLSESGSPSQPRGSDNGLRHEDIIFGAIGGKDSGLIRSKSSISAEKREAEKKKKKEMHKRQRSQGSDVAGPSGRAGSSESASTSPETEDERGRVGSAVSDDALSSVRPTPASGVAATADQSQIQAEKQPLERSHSASQQPTPTSLQLDDGSVEEVVGSNPVSRSQSDTPGPGDGLISLRDDVDMGDDDDEDEDEGEDEDDESNGSGAEEPDLDDVFAGRALGRRH